MSETAPEPSLDEFRALLDELPQNDQEARDAAAARQAELTKPAGSLGRLEELAEWLAGWQGRALPQVERPLTAVFAGNHGVAAQGVSAYPAEVTRQMVQNFIDGGAAVNQLCALVDSGLRVYEMALDQPTRDFTAAPAMDAEDCARAISYGMMTVEEGIDVLVLGEMGIANTTSAAALCHGLYGGEAQDWVGRGTGVDDRGLSRKVQVVDQAVALHASKSVDPFDLLCRLGGQELAAILGAVLAARMARIPVLLDGFACTAAGAVLHAARPGALDHCKVAHVSVEPGHRRLLAKIGQRPLLDLDMRLGEASGAILGVMLLKAAVACHNSMATFTEAGVSGRES